jgi:hypothetical protein
MPGLNDLFVWSFKISLFEFSYPTSSFQILLIG